MRPRSFLVAALALCAVLLVACGGEDSAPASDALTRETTGEARVIATTTILGDVVRNSTCDGVVVDTLLSVGQDPHSFELSARQATELRDADLVVANGLDLEEAFTDVLLDAADSGTAVLFLAEELDPIPFGWSRSPELGGDATDADGALDPHVWMDPRRMAEAARLVGAELSARTSTDHESCAAEYAAELEALDAEVAARLAAVPAESRRLVTNHDSLGYFAERYGFAVVDTVIPGGATLAEPSAGDVVELIERIDASAVRAIFADETASSELARVIAAETVARVEVVSLFSGSLGGSGSGADTYVEMIRTNVERIADALGGSS